LSARNAAMLIIVCAPLCILGFTTLAAYFAWLSYPRLWLKCSAVLASSSAIVAYLPIRCAFFAPEMSDLAGMPLFAEFMGVTFILGGLNLASFVVLVSAVAQERQRQGAEKRNGG
jgi:hypothetical protein